MPDFWTYLSRMADLLVTGMFFLYVIEIGTMGSIGNYIKKKMERYSNGRKGRYGKNS